MSGALSAEERRRATHAFVHDIMGQLHMVLACSGLTYADVAKVVGEREKRITRMFYDFDFVARDPSAIKLVAYIASACGHRITFGISPIPASIALPADEDAASAS